MFNTPTGLGPRLARAAALVSALAACGGSNSPDATLSATDDAATLDWRSSAWLTCWPTTAPAAGP